MSRISSRSVICATRTHHVFEGRNKDSMGAFVPGLGLDEDLDFLHVLMVCFTTKARRKSLSEAHRFPNIASSKYSLNANVQSLIIISGTFRNFAHSHISTSHVFTFTFRLTPVDTFAPSLLHTWAEFISPPLDLHLLEAYCTRHSRCIFIRNMHSQESHSLLGAVVLLCSLAYIISMLVTVHKGWRMSRERGCAKSRSLSWTEYFSSWELTRYAEVQRHEYLDGATRRYAEFDNTFQTTMFGATLFNTMDPENVKAVLSVENRPRYGCLREPGAA
jgi:hypothetical protein